MLTNNKSVEGKYRFRIMLRDIFGFAEYQRKSKYGLGYKLTLTGESDNSVLNEANVTNNAKNKINCIEWYKPQYTPYMEQQKLNSQQTLSLIPTELQHVERPIFTKEVKTRSFSTFELRTYHPFFEIFIYIFLIQLIVY